MKKIALFFPGQGSQYPGLFKPYYENNSEFIEIKKAIDLLDSEHSIPLKTLGLEGSKEEIAQTQFTQPLIVATSLFQWEKLKSLLGNDYQVELVMGHSVGEFAALASQNVMDAKTVLETVYHRGLLMSQTKEKGTMFALIGLEGDLVMQACQHETEASNWVQIANYNDLKQIVIGGHESACQKVIERLKINHKFRAIQLSVSAPFHTEIMLEASKQMQSYLQDVPLKDLTTNYIAGCDAKLYESPTEATLIKENVSKGMSNPVFWYQAMKKADEVLDSETLCIELGPGRVLQGLAKKITPEREFFSFDKDIEKIQERL